MPIGHADFIQRKLAAPLLGELRELPDLQIAWLLLLYCASPRAQHVLRTVPPRDAAAYASEHDQAVWTTVQHILAEPDARGQQWGAARQVAFLPAAAGGLGLASAERLAPAAYWAAWADALPVMLQRRPDAARRCAHKLALGGVSAAPCLRAAAAAGDMLLAEGWVERPEWDSGVGFLLRGAQPAPSPPESSESGVWPHGWQKPAARVLNISYRERLLCSSPPSSRALLRSQAGAHAGEWLRAIPTDEGTQLLPLDMQLALRRRLHLPLPLAASRCGGQGKPGCRALVDQFGDHRAACARSGLLARRAPILERAWVRVAREAVALVWRQMTDAGWTSASMARPGGVNSDVTRSSLAQARSAWSCWPRRSADVGTTLSVTLRDSAPFARRRHCALPPARGGHAGGGGSWVAPCNAPWLRRSLGTSGAHRRSQLRLTTVLCSRKKIIIQNHNTKQQATRNTTATDKLRTTVTFTWVRPRDVKAPIWRGIKWARQ